MKKVLAANPEHVTEDDMKKSLGPKTLLYPTPVWVIGTYDKEGKPNVMTIAWGGLLYREEHPKVIGGSVWKAKG